ncbi:serine protease Do [Aequitasia blattaphilus]|uniref:Trypsin-like peptidase domain-containing protein n=1 Tax=Aequitasia blattaphilus TaxID=2949332 RepID=A0ABT1E690_9FIRM|nr:trypsin-like peptidase domain-containing protein [Aequitasia blattaphilus]MCP1101353.1 trypsin-like peptidase domain-containing protein [Aequitasia blattaphilus]MCR8613993.1 trypsin-like peptidase domain-containing protein [Aequitasia blattaphilus]
MDNNYYYEMPDNNSNQESPIHQNRKPERPKHPTPGWVKAIIFGVIFGMVGGITFQGTSILISKVAGYQSSGNSSADAATTKTAESTTLTTSSGSTVSSDISAIAENAMPSVVSITNMSVQQVRDFFGGIRESESESAGSGIIIQQNDTELLIVTNNHVVEGSDTLTVSFVDEESVDAQIKGTNAEKDLAVIAVKKSDVKEETMDAIKVATIGDSTKLKVGEPAIAIGNALGYGQSVTTGIVSAMGRTLELDGFESELIQTDAAINPGNSGGALLNANGEVVGINTVKASDVTVEGMGYAIPISDASEEIANLMNQETKEKVAESERGYLGVSIVDISQENAELYNMPKGVFISEVQSGGGVDKAGIKKGSIITGLNGTSISSMEVLQEQLQYYRAGETVTLKIQVADKDGQYSEQEVEVTLSSNRK